MKKIFYLVLKIAFKLCIYKYTQVLRTKFFYIQFLKVCIKNRSIVVEIADVSINRFLHGRFSESDF